MVPHEPALAGGAAGYHGRMRSTLWLAVWLGLAPTAGPEPAGGVAASAGTSAASVAALAEVTGTVRSVDRALRLVEVATPTGPVVLRYDRNTLVYQPGGATTPLSIAPGMALRAGHDAAGVAYWIQLRPAP